MRLADGSAPEPISLALLTDAASSAVLEIGARGSSTIDLTAHLRFGQPRDVTAAGLAVEAFFPADRGTADRLRELAGG